MRDSSFGTVLIGAALLVLAPSAAVAQTLLPGALPRPVADPLRIDFSKDPILAYGRNTAPADNFRATIARAVENHPGLREAEAAERVTVAERQEARSGLFPTLDLGFTNDRSLSRQFGNNDDNAVVERVRPYRRTDATATVTQTLFDFGATSRRIRAASARESAAEAQIESSADDVALRAISAWYDLAGYSALVEMGSTLDLSQGDLAEAVKMRILQGLSAEGDLARVQAYISNSQARLAGFRRSLSNAEARYVEATGLPAPKKLERPALIARLPATIEDARILAQNSPQVRQAQLAARAARADWGAVNADNLPRVQGQIDAGRYGVFENDNDYDVRARIIVRHRLTGGGGQARSNQARARYEQAMAAAERTTQEAEREAAITFSDIKASELEVTALEKAYIANRQARDVLIERFRSTQGSLTDVLTSEDNYFQIAASYLQAVTRLDAERLVLLQRGGNLLPALGVNLTGSK